MNEHQTAGENSAFLQYGPCKRYLYVGICQDMRRSSLHMYYYIFVRKNLAKFRRMHLHRGLFSTCNLQLYRKETLAYIAFCELVLKGEFYEKSRTDVLALITTALSKTRHCEGKCIYLRTMTEN